MSKNCLSFFLVRIWVQIRNIYMYYIRNAILINCYVDDRCWHGINHRNWGDDLNYYLMNRISNRPIVVYNGFWLARKLKKKNYLCIGTLLDAVNYSNPQTVVWGSGVSGQERSFVPPLEICSVRGYKTLEFLSTHGIECPNSFGDPALLLPRYYSPFFQRKKYKLGIIPHVIDLDFDVIKKIRETQTDILIIDLAHYEKWTDVIDQICSCEIIASSSLHGLIVSDAYNIPNCWITLSGKISGGLFKFYDYFSSVNRKDSEPIKIDKISDLLQVYKQVSLWKSIEIDTDEIIKCCPFLNK